MTNINNLTQLRNHIKTAEAFDGEPFNYKGFNIWWNEECDSVQTPTDGYFRCDPTTDSEYKDYRRLTDKTFGGYEWVLS